jgi:D-proline reductase (dithiol) PrdB
VPVLARTLETAGLATILITMMPVWAEKIGVPRTLAVEFPFGHTLGMPGDTAQQMRVLLQALDTLQLATGPGHIEHSTEKWSEPVEAAVKSWQPLEPSPIIAELSPKFREMLRSQRRNR